MIHFLLLTTEMLGVLMAGAGLLHLIPKLGTPGRRLSDALCRAPQQLLRASDLPNGNE